MDNSIPNNTKALLFSVSTKLQSVEGQLAVAQVDNKHLTSRLLAAEGLLTARGVLEFVLRNIHRELKSSNKAHFNATGAILLLQEASKSRGIAITFAVPIIFVIYENKLIALAQNRGFRP